MQELTEDYIQQEDTLSDKANKKSKSHFEQLKAYTKTYITFNKGGKWNLIVAPERDSLGKKYDCGEYCYLNLNGINSKYPPYYSVDKAVGIIIGNGKIGRYLSQNDEDLSTFLSRDGGVSWFEVLFNIIILRSEKELIFMRLEIMEG